MVLLLSLASQYTHTVAYHRQPEGGLRTQPIALSHFSVVQLSYYIPPARSQWQTAQVVWTHLLAPGKEYL